MTATALRRDPAGTSKHHIDRQANALGSLWTVCPKLAAKCSRMHNYAKAVQTYLRAVDFYCLQHNVSPRRVRIDTHVEGDRIVQRISG
jgi:hypothetical protein